MKHTKRWLMIAAILLLAGLTLGFSVLAMHWGDWTAFNTVEPMEPVSQSVAADAVTRLEVELDSADVRLVQTEDDSFHIQWYEGSQPRFQMELKEDGTLRITQETTQRSPVQIDFSSVTYALLIEVPKQFRGDTELTSEAGDIALRALDLPGDLRCRSVSGDVDLRDAGISGSLSIETQSGEVQALGGGAANGIAIASASGDLALTRIQAPALTLQTTSGQVELERVQVSGPLTAETQSGDVAWKDLDAGEMQISTVSGEVEGALSELYQVHTETESGEVEVEGERQGPRPVDISTVSGDITIR